jgi:renalase
MPVPQVLELGCMNKIIGNDPDLLRKLSSVQYSSRYALALFFDDGPEAAKLSLSKDHPDTGAQYIKDDPIFCYAAMDSLNKNSSGPGPTSVVFHTKVAWGLEYLSTPIDQVEKMLTDHYQKRYPDWSRPSSVKCQRWRYSQVLNPYQDCPGALVLNDNPLLIAGGDGFMKVSGFDSCIDSAAKIVELIKAKI